METLESLVVGRRLRVPVEVNAETLPAETGPGWGEVAARQLDPVGAEHVRPALLDLLTLPGYGTYQHSYADLLAAHAELIPLAGDRVTVLALGGSLAAEVRELYLSLACSEVPPAAEDLAALRLLAAACEEEPERVPVRENRAAINQVRLVAGRPLLVDTVTDVLRIASDDVTLATATKSDRSGAPSGVPCSARSTGFR